MDFFQVQRQLNDLPSTYLRPGPPFTQLVDSITAGLVLFTQALDALTPQMSFPTALGGWIDIWGSLAGLIRNQNEGDIPFLNRISNTLVAWRDSILAIQRFCQLVENATIGVAEVQPVGYIISFPNLYSLQQLQKFINDIAWVRPAGVPYTVRISSATYLDTVNYYGQIGTQDIITVVNNGNYGLVLTTEAGVPISADPPFTGRVTGAYLVGGSITGLAVPSSTDNAVGILPDILLTDPTINPGLPPVT